MTEQDITIIPEGESPVLLAEWLSRGELARELSISTNTLSRWAARRHGPPCTLIGRKVFYRRAAVLTWLRAQEQAFPARNGRGRSPSLCAELLARGLVTPGRLAERGVLP